MIAISQLTQSRLSVVLLDKTTNALLNKIPVYAEMTITVELPPYTIHQELEFNESERLIQNWFVQHRFVLDSINQVIIGNVSEDDFNATDKHKLYITILADLKDNLNDSEPEANKQLLITKMVMKALRDFEIRTNPQSNKQTLHSFPLGTLASDHAGYLSYDLTNAISRFKSMVQGAVTSDVSFFVYPLAREDLKINVLQQGRFTPEVIFGRLPIELPKDFDEINRVNLPSMHNPSLEDWYLSPGSFALNPAFFVGADGCENLYPANFATHEFSFFQVVRGTRVLIEPRDGVLEARTGWSLEYLVSWQPLGHTLGQIVYSLPLAPGEIIKIAVLDWARKSIDSRNEDLTVKEQLVHNTHRDRNISETVDAAMQEWQRGGSFMGGIAGSYGGAGYGISGALGGGYSTSSGDRNVHASTVQQISDSFAQASSSVRELRSTIVIQSDQQEHVKAETRVVANHNHSHALTMLYYEVLRHYKVTTQFSRLRPSLMVQYGHIDFRNINNIVHHRKILESVLIEGRYLACFDAVEKLQCFTTEFERKKAQAALAPNLNDSNELGEIKLVIKTQKATNGHAFVFITTKNRQEITCLLVSPSWHSGLLPTQPPQFKNSLPSSVDDPSSITIDPNYRQDGQENVFTVKPFKTVLWNDVEGIFIKVQFAGTPWITESIQVTAQPSGGPVWIMLDNKEVTSIAPDGQKFFPVKPYREIPNDPADGLSEPERCCIQKLMNHLAENSFHYKKAIWLLEDPNERANRFKTMKVTSGEAVIDLIDNRPIDVLGDYVVFPARKFHENNEELNALERVEVEKLMTLPTRGVFAEAKLGHCNVSEEIDNTRFWDWQVSPIPEQTPGIDNVNVNESKNATPNLTPTQLPSSIVNIVNPSNLPDPTGLANALNLLGKADIFRDMSVSKEVEDLLKNLANNSVSMGQASSKAGNILQQRGSSGGSSGGNTTSGPAKPSPDEQHNQLQVLRNAVNNGDITKEKKNQLAADYLQNATQPNATLAFSVDATTAAGAEMVTLKPLHADEAGEILISYQFGQFAIIIPQAVIFNAREEIADVNVHVFFAAGGVQKEDHSDLLLHGLRGASNQSDWVTIAVRGIDDQHPNPISEAQILECLQAVNIKGNPKKLRLSGHSRGADSLVGSISPGKITSLNLIDRVTFLDEAVEHHGAFKGDNTPDPDNGKVSLNRVSILQSLNIPVSKMVSYEVSHRSEDKPPARPESRRVSGADYIELGPNSMAAIGCIRLIHDAEQLNPDIATKLRNKPALKKLVDDLVGVPLPPRGSFTTKGVAGKTDFIDFYLNTAKTEIAAITAAANSVLAFVNGENLTSYMRIQPFPFSWWAAGHHFFVAEIAHELTD